MFHPEMCTDGKHRQQKVEQLGSLALIGCSCSLECLVFLSRLNEIDKLIILLLPFTCLLGIRCSFHDLTAAEVPTLATRTVNHEVQNLCVGSC